MMEQMYDHFMKMMNAELASSLFGKQEDEQSIIYKWALEYISQIKPPSFSEFFDVWLDSDEAKFISEFPLTLEQVHNDQSMCCRLTTDYRFGYGIMDFNQIHRL